MLVAELVNRFKIQLGVEGELIITGTVVAVQRHLLCRPALQ